VVPAEEPPLSFANVSKLTRRGEKDTNFQYELGYMLLIFKIQVIARWRIQMKTLLTHAHPGA
jgi:hypothetical protein